MSNQNNNAKLFSKQFNPFRAKHTRQFNDQANLFEPTTWKTIDNRLTNNLIEQGLMESTTVGYFNKRVTRLIGFDIDDHVNKKDNYELTETLRNKFKQVQGLVYNQTPSCVFQSPNGLHVYYFLNMLLPFKLIQMILQKQATKIGGVEVKPADNHSLRLPSMERQLDPVTLTPVAFDIVKIPFYSPVNLFLWDYLPLQLRHRVGGVDSDEYNGSGNLRDEVRLSKVERSLTPFFIGETNDKFLSITRAYFNAGLTVEQATDRLLWLIIESSPAYTGELKDQRKRVEERIESNYARLRKNRFVDVEKYAELELWDEPLIDILVKQSPFGKQREKALRFFLIKLFSYINYHARLKENYSDYILYAYIYQPFYDIFRKDDCFPLPSVMLKNWNNRYHEIIDYLVDKGVLYLKHDYWYGGEHDELNRCRYYKVNRTILVEKDKREEVLRRIEERGDTVGQISNATGIPKGTVSRYLKKDRKMSNENLEKLVNYLK